MQSIGNDSQKVIETIEITKKDEVYLKINCEAGVAQEICDYFTFSVPGYTFMPAYRMKIWDGKIRLFNIHNRVLYGGLLEYVFKFAENRHYEVVPDGDWWKPIKIEENKNFNSKSIKRKNSHNRTYHFFSFSVVCRLSRIWMGFCQILSSSLCWTR